MRRVAIAILFCAGTVGNAVAQPHGEPVPPEDRGPHGEPVPPEERGPHGEPVAPEQKPDEQKPPSTGDQKPPEQKPPEQKPPEQKPADQPKPPDPKAPYQKGQQPAPPQPGTQTGTQKVQQPAPPQPGTQKTIPPGPPPPGTQQAPRPADMRIAPSGPSSPSNVDLTIQQHADQSTLPPAQPADLVGSAEIKKIVVEDNTKTTSETVEVIAGIEVGDQWSTDMVDVVKSRLVSSGLFKDVEVYWTRVPDGVAVHILAKDKHSWVIAPAVYSQPTNKGGGVGFGENNLFGQNQKLLLYGQIATGDTFFIGAWLVPSIAGTRFYSQLDTYLKSSRNIEYTAPDSYMVDAGDLQAVRESRIHYLNVGGKLGITLWRALKLDGRLRGAKVSYQDVHLSEGATIDQVQPGADPNSVPAPGKEGADISTEWDLTIDKRANWYGVETGYRYNLAYEHALPSFGSDFDYWITSFNGRRAYQVLARHNLVIKGALNYGHNLPFQQEFLAGGTSMRGWLNNEFRGNFRALANLEYSVPVFTIKGFSVRALTFFDSAYTTFINTKENEKDGTRSYLVSGKMAEVRGLAPFKNSIGVGTRFYLRQIVLPLLGLDFGYGLEARDFQVYLAIGLTD